jgi:hypothetical protein
MPLASVLLFELSLHRLQDVSGSSMSYLLIKRKNGLTRKSKNMICGPPQCHSQKSILQSCINLLSLLDHFMGLLVHPSENWHKRRSITTARWWRLQMSRKTLSVYTNKSKHVQMEKIGMGGRHPHFQLYSHSSSLLFSIHPLLPWNHFIRKSMSSNAWVTTFLVSCSSSGDSWRAVKCNWHHGLFMESMSCSYPLLSKHLFRRWKVTEVNLYPSLSSLFYTFLSPSHTCIRVPGKEQIEVPLANPTQIEVPGLS